MFVKRLKLNNFRNYNTLNIDFSKNLNLIYGENAQGKTNILEAVFLCSSGRSHRTSKDSELIKLDSPGFYIKTEFEKSQVDESIEIIYRKEEKKNIKINEIPVKKIGDLIGNFKTVIFSPEDLLVIKEGPKERRRFIDITLSQLRPYYFYDLQQYNKVLDQRNALLREIKIRRYGTDTLEVWNQNLVKIGSRIIKARSEFIKRINEKAVSTHFKLTNDRERIELRYVPSITQERYDNIEEIENRFIRNIKALTNKEIEKGSTMCGPQRDDYEIYINEKNIRVYGSQGQQRTAILSIKLSEIDIMKEETGEYPVLLLDDVMSELDRKRQEYLVDSIKDIQTIITCTDKDSVNKDVHSEAKFFNVKNGEIK